jgi:hypothetical protein
MRGRARTRLVVVLLAVAVATVLVLLGRVTAGTGTARAEGYRSGHASGVREGHAGGVQEGRAVQLVLSLPPGSRDVARAAFDAGYAAGANDVFGGYDGGWGLSMPYLVTLSQGEGGVTYRIDSRTPLRDGVNYYLCSHTHQICQESR